jgi:hypothetical protein
MRRQAGSGRAPGAAARGEAAGSSGHRSEGDRHVAWQTSGRRLPPPQPGRRKRRARGPAFSGETPEDTAIATAGVQRRSWRGVSSLAGRLGAVRSGAARISHGAGCDSWSSSLTPSPPVAWSGSAAFTWGQASERSPAKARAAETSPTCAFVTLGEDQPVTRGPSPILPPPAGHHPVRTAPSRRMTCQQRTRPSPAAFRSGGPWPDAGGVVRPRLHRPVPRVSTHGSGGLRPVRSDDPFRLFEHRAPDRGHGRGRRRGCCPSADGGDPHRRLHGCPGQRQAVLGGGHGIPAYCRGKVAQLWGFLDQLGLMQQIGGLPAPGRAGESRFPLCPTLPAAGPRRSQRPTEFSSRASERFSNGQVEPNR